MAEGDITITAVYNDSIYSLIVVNGSGSGSYTMGTQVNVVAAPDEVGMRFIGWSSDAGGIFDEPNSYDTIFHMPAGNATVTANYEHSLYILEVIGGTGSGEYVMGSRVVISADIPEGHTFTGWTVNGIGSFDNAALPETIFNMPPDNTSVTANFIPYPVLTVVNGVTDSGFTTGAFPPGSVINILADEKTEPGYTFMNVRKRRLVRNRVYNTRKRRNGHGGIHVCDTRCCAYP
jgi:uncharacterized repeat protein (TIGR02543 family)